MRLLRRAADSLVRLVSGVVHLGAAGWRFLAALPARVARLVGWLAALIRSWLAALAALITRMARFIARNVVRMLPAGHAFALVVAVAGVLAVVLGTSAFAASRLNAEYGAGTDKLNTLVWAGRAQSYAGATCTACHETEQEMQAGIHVGVSCEGCHGPLVDHPATDSGTASRLVLPDSEACITCHASTEGQPGGFPEVDPEQHYAGNACLRCHDPHAVLAVAPPDVTHPLVRLPACTTCHRPDGLKKVPSGHEMVADDVCLSCHGVPNDDE